LPALAKAREKARSISCVNKLKQTATGLFLYAGDAEDYFPSRSNSNWKTLFFTYLVGIPNTTSNKYANEGAMGNYLPISVLACPSMPGQNLSGSGTNYDWWCKNPHYGVNERLYHGLPTSGAGLEESRKLGQILNPSRKYFVADTFAQTSAGVPDRNKGHWRLLCSTSYKANTGFACFAGRHGGMFNASRCDGSVSSGKVLNIDSPYSQWELHSDLNQTEFYWNK
ncbi:MAG: DUF1559 domain-containing protein, partial [Victivallales bacterium]|nr:DUF1559 domain-containing protein [Victivallales bacterium]